MDRVGSDVPIGEFEQSMVRKLKGDFGEDTKIWVWPEYTGVKGFYGNGVIGNAVVIWITERPSMARHRLKAHKFPDRIDKIFYGLLREEGLANMHLTDFVKVMADAGKSPTRKELTVNAELMMREIELLAEKGKTLIVIANTKRVKAWMDSYLPAYPSVHIPFFKHQIRFGKVDSLRKSLKRIVEMTTCAQEKPDYTETVKQVMVPMFYKEAQMGRSIGRGAQTFKRELFNSIMTLRCKVDDGTLKNQNIRREIRELAKRTSVSVGQAQKVINVYLKYYCLLRDITNLIVELDCPVDSGIIKAVLNQPSIKGKHGPKSFANLHGATRLKNIDYPTYIFLQERLENMGSGVRLQRDIQSYDKKRIENFLSDNNK